jgi:hypothetical protein
MNAIPYMAVHTFRQLFQKRVSKFKQGGTTYPAGEEKRLRDSWLLLQNSAITASNTTKITLASINWPGPHAEDDSGPSLEEMTATEDWLREQMGEEAGSGGKDAEVSPEKPQKG